MNVILVCTFVISSIYELLNHLLSVNMDYKRQNPANNTDIPIRKPKQNKKILAQTARVNGKSFINTRGVVKPARVSGPDCK